MERLSISRFFFITLIVFFCFFYFPQNSLATSLQENEKALNMIADFADRLCKDIPLVGGVDNLELSGGAKAELTGMIKQLADLGIDGAIKYQDSNYEGLLQKDLVSALKDSTNCRLQVWNDLKDKFISSNTSIKIDQATARYGVTLGWQLGRYEFIYDSPFPEAREASIAAKRDIEMMLRQDNFPHNVSELDAQQLISTVLMYYGSSDPVKRSTILLGIAAMRASLIGSSSDQESNEELKQLAQSAIHDIDSSIIQQKQDLFSQILATKPTNVTAVLELLNDIN